MLEETLDKLIDAATEAIGNSYSPYSSFPVGAAVLTESGRIYGGTNIENASYGATVCAERVAIFKAVSEGDTHITAVAIYTNAANLAFPCGMCALRPETGKRSCMTDSANWCLPETASAGRLH